VRPISSHDVGTSGLNVNCCGKKRGNSKEGPGEKKKKKKKVKDWQNTKKRHVGTPGKGTSVRGRLVDWESRQSMIQQRGGDGSYSLGGWGGQG